MGSSIVPGWPSPTCSGGDLTIHTKRLREMLHRSPREFGRESSLRTPAMAADVAFEEGLTEEHVSGETVRATLSRVLGIRWMRAKRWITSPDPLYERKKGGATD
jgi:hypothetical protein